MIIISIINSFLGQPGTPGQPGLPSYQKPTVYPTSTYPGSPGNIFNSIDILS